MSPTLAVVPARGGSKRIPDKNLKEVGDRSLLAHAIEQGKQAEEIDRLIVSTEDSELRSEAEACDAEVPFARPGELSTDEASTSDVVLHALDWFEEDGETFNFVCVLQPTVPFRTPTDIDASIRRLVETGADSVVTITEFAEPPFWAVEPSEDQIMPYFEENPWKRTRSQEFPTLFRPNGAVFAARVPAFRASGDFYAGDTTYWRMPRRRSIDIDEPYDLEVARALAAWREQ